ncbi:hypothetical protein PAQ31011_00952 [Pandoraea aquatica]|uniref:DUF4148 domain-containing protein n=1 Tax=Pandoraea aquatica TaxID=2508290 RepID=A0A5E4SQZ0_9BURK|nr:DUF4148 domain-containing protein [Pandoraea aquatica]VVD77392.1 hypothetical protein PAQ31011_00952 [Pandoraea aquatica]
MKKTSILYAAALAITTASTVAFAAPQSGLTREYVVAELKALQDVGYDGTTDRTRYPANLLAANAELAKRELARNAAPDTAHDASNPAMARTDITTGVATGDAMPASASATKRAAYGGALLHAHTYRGQ